MKSTPIPGNQSSFEISQLFDIAIVLWKCSDIIF